MKHLTHEDVLKKCGIPPAQIVAWKADPKSIDWGGILKQLGPVILQILSGLLSGLAPAPTP